MKKIIIPFLIIFILAGCKAEKQTAVQLFGLSFDCKASYNGGTVAGNIKAYGGGVFSFTLSEPQLISGTEVKYDGETVTINYLGLSYSPQLPLPADDTNTVLNTVIATAAGGKTAKLCEDKYILEDKAGDLAYTLTVTESGLPLSLSVPDAGLSAEFSNVTLIK